MIRPPRPVPRCAVVPGFRLGALALLEFLLAAAPATLFAGTHAVQRARKATAEVVRDGDDWVVSVEFIPSRSLGTAGDLETNRRLARDYALRGLFRELAGESGNEIVVSGFETERSEEADGLWKARFRTPANGVSMQPKPEAAPGAEHEPDGESAPEAEHEPDGEPAESAPTAESTGVSSFSERAAEPVAESAPVSTGPAPVAPDCGIPKLKVPEIKVPELAVPELKVPELKAPEVKAPEVETPELPATSPLENEP